MIVIPDAGKIELLTKTLLAPLVTDEAYSLRLYTNDYTPAAGSVLGNFLETGFAGYYRRDLLRSSWGVPTIIAGRASSSYAVDPLEWTCTAGPVTLHGYYVVAPASGVVAWAERFNVPRTLLTGSKLQISAVLTGRGEV
jgi:hypothetical protein